MNARKIGDHIAKSAVNGDRRKAPGQLLLPNNFVVDEQGKSHLNTLPCAGENMNQPDAQTSPNYVTCPCQHCSGNIEFDANQLDGAENVAVPCPHCGLETRIRVTEQKIPPLLAGDSIIKHSNQKGRRTWETYETMRRAAEGGDPQAQCYVGVCYQNGLCGAQDYYEAVKWFNRSAEHGDPIAQCHLGVCYLNGLGVSQDYGLAAKWFREAADQGDSAAQFNLGVLCEIGEGVPQNYAEAVRWYHAAAEKGELQAQFNLGVFYEEGQVVPQNCEEAARWYRAAAEQDFAPAQLNLGMCYYTGSGVVRDQREAMKWIRHSAEQGDPQAQSNLSLAYYSGEGVPQNYVEAYKWANLAAANGIDSAKELLDSLAQEMTSSQIEEGQRLVSFHLAKIHNSTNHTVQERPARAAIPSDVRREVWRRDGGTCVKCGSRRNLEYDHIVPVSKGGGNTARNIELLCETCNRSKSASIQ